MSQFLEFGNVVKALLGLLGSKKEILLKNIKAILIEYVEQRINTCFN